MVTLNILFVTGIGIIAFLLVILLLVFLILTAKEKLVASGSVKLKINNDTLEVSPGSSLLSTLASNKIFLASACGGKGTCALCKCQVDAGGGDVLITEKNHLNKKEVGDHWRLACQVKVKEDMAIRIPEAVFKVNKWSCEVVSNRNVATFIKEFVVRIPEGQRLNFESGGYIQIYIPPYDLDFETMRSNIQKEFHGDWDKFNIWGLKGKNDEEIFRAYSMANHPAEGNIVMLNVRIATPPWDRAKNAFQDVLPGIASSYIFSLRPGDKVDVSGPYGEFHIKPTEKEMLYIGGGAGMAPLRSHIFHLFKTDKTKRKVTYWYGGRSLRELFYTDHFREIEKDFSNFKYNIALSEPMPEDKWNGATGFIHQAVEQHFLKTHKEPEEVEYYLCGPPQMLQACLRLLENYGIPEENVDFDEF